MKLSGWAALCGLILAAGTTTPRGGPPFPAGPAPSVLRALPPEPPRRIELRDLSGWTAEDHDTAFAVWRANCPIVRDPGVADLCARARATGDVAPGDGRTFFERSFVAERIPGEGVLTAYFAPVYPARRNPDGEFSAPVRPRPADLSGENGAVVQVLPGGVTQPYPDRAAIEATPAEAPLAWMRPEELFFLQVQGSGVLVFEDGRQRRDFLHVDDAMRSRGIETDDYAFAGPQGSQGRSPAAVGRRKMRAPDLGLQPVLVEGCGDS